MSRPHKYGARKTACPHGHEHPSKAEALRCAELHLLQKAGHIRDLERGKAFKLTVDGVTIGRYTPDFAYWTENARVVEEVKSPATAKATDYRLRMRLFRACYPGVRVVETIR